MAEVTPAAIRSKIKDWLNLTAIATVVALALSVHNYYRSFWYVSQQLEVTVTELSYVTNKGELYMVLAFSNPGNRDAAVIRTEPLLWEARESTQQWKPLGETIPELPLTAPHVPMIVRAGGVEVVTLSARLDPAAAEEVSASKEGGAFVGVRVSSMNASGDLYHLEQPVALLKTDAQGRIVEAEPRVHHTLHGFSDAKDPPPGEAREANGGTKKTPAVWAEPHWRTDS